jgi:hypothetical protein
MIYMAERFDSKGIFLGNWHGTMPIRKLSIGIDIPL